MTKKTLHNQISIGQEPGGSVVTYKPNELGLILKLIDNGKSNSFRKITMTVSNQ